MSAAIRLNGEEHPLRADTIAALLREQGLEASAPGLAVALNGAVVPRRDWSATALRAGDAVEIVKPFAGG